MRTQGTYYIRGTEGRKDGRTDGRTEGRNAENYVPPLFFEKAGDKNVEPKRYKLWSCQKIGDAFHFLLDNIFIRFGSKLYRQIVGILMGTNCAPLNADFFCFN